MRGASAIQQLLEDIPGADVRVLVVWEPVLWSDVAPPLSTVLAKIPDGRVIQHWDPHRTLSDEIVRAVRRGETELPCVESVREDTVAWDVVAIFPPGVRWDAHPPEPAYCGYPVVSAIDRVREHLAAATDQLFP